MVWFGSNEAEDGVRIVWDRHRWIIPQEEIGMKGLDDSNLTEGAEAEVEADVQNVEDWDKKLELKRATTVRVASHDILV